MTKVRWGVLSTARIGIRKVIPAMQAGRLSDVTAIASRRESDAQRAARELGLEKAYGSYEELLADPEIDAVYIPLPNHLHVPWSLRALEAGKHVLCEKPIGLSSAEAEEVLAAARKRPHLKVMEAFMYRHHPQWRRVRQLIADGEIGEVRTVHSLFSYHRTDPGDIRNQPELGGGGLLDIGCYCVSVSRFAFDAEPREARGIVEYDPRLGIDRLASGILDFGTGHAVFTCATQQVGSQRVSIFGTQGRLEVEVPFTAPPDRPCKIRHYRGGETVEITVEASNQYTVQGDLFSRAVLEDGEVPTPLEDAVANMKVIEDLIRSSGQPARAQKSGEKISKF